MQVLNAFLASVHRRKSEPILGHITQSEVVTNASYLLEKAKNINGQYQTHLKQ